MANSKMKTQLSSLEINYLVKELQTLIDSKIDKIYHPSKSELILNLHSPKIKKQSLQIKVPNSIYLTTYVPQSHEPSEFCMFLRKKLNNARIRKINQLESERIIELDIETKEDNYKLIIEMFAKGNILLTKNNEILSAIYYQKFKDRTIRPKIKYQYPKREYNFLNLELKQIKELLKKSNKESLVKSLALDLGLGGTYSEEVCYLAKIDKNLKTNELNRKKAEDVLKAINKLIKTKLNPRIIYKNNEVKDIVPIKLNFYKDLKYKEFKNYNEALNYYFTEEHEKQKIFAKKQTHKKELDKIEDIIKKQQQKIKQLINQEKHNKKTAEIIYEKYQLINNILTEIKKARNKLSLKEIKAKLKNHKIIKDLNEKDKTILIEI